jgi:catechol 2,3-dioxygenase-like lactoylglutathione lyase family enzyme
MELPAIKGFGHIDLTVSDVDRSVAWWDEVLGFKLVTHASDRTSSSALSCTQVASSSA